MAKNSQGETTGDIELYELPKPSTTTLAYMEDYDEKTHIKEIQKNLTQVVFANENVPMLPNNEIGTHRFPEENGRNSGNGNSNENRKQFQQSRSQTKSSSDVKSFNRNGDNDSPFDKRLSSNAGSSVCQKSCNGVILLIMIGSLLKEAGLISRMI